MSVPWQSLPPGFDGPLRALPVLFFVLAPLCGARAEAPQATLMPQEKLQPFLNEYCLDCHGAKRQRGDVRFDEVNWKITNNDEAQRWQDVLDVLNGGDMPPEDETQPTADELSRTLDVLTGRLLTARKRLTDHNGEIALRRLNQREYANSIRDLFGFEVPLDRIPEDGEVDSFDTVGSEQFFTSSHFDKYLLLAREIVEQGFVWAERQRSPARASRREPEARVTDRLRVALADLDEKMRMKKAGKSWQEMGFKDAGEAEIIFSQFDSRAGKPRRYLQYPLVESGIYMAEVNNETRRFGHNMGGADPRGFYKFRIRAGVVGSPPEIRQFALVTDNESVVGTMKVRGTTEQPEVVEMQYRPTFDQRAVSLQVAENRADIRVLEAYLNRLDPEGEWASIWIDWLEIEGPFYDEERAFFETLLHPEAPEPGKQTRAWDSSNARELIERFAFEAFRRQAPTKAYLDRLVELFEANQAAGQGFQESMAEVLAVVLASPGFLFLQEASSGEKGPSPLSDRELAVRLAYFLWSAPPDAALYRSAEEGRLQEPKELRRQVDRLLDDPRAESFHRGFASQWADLDRFDAITVDPQAYVHFNRGIRQSAYREVLEFFGALVEENLPVRHLIDSDFVVINNLLAEHYEIGDVDSDAFQKVVLPQGSPRGGLLGQAAFLTLGSNGERSSPVIRGALVMEKLLHDPPPPPPPNVPELGAATDKPASNREMVELHQRQPVCASCHKKMDVIGFGLENFDTIGRWRETEKVGNRQVPIEPGGTLPDGDAFEDVQGLKSALLVQERALAREMVESLMAYGLGRTIEFSDDDDVEAILQSLTAEDFPVRSMIHEVVASSLFQSK